jgi:hypothetical protein
VVVLAHATAADSTLTDPARTTPTIRLDTGCSVLVVTNTATASIPRAVVC